MEGSAGALLFPWERSVFGDRTEKLAWWQKAYWGAFGCVGVYWAGERGYNKVTTGKWRGKEPPPPGRPKPRYVPHCVGRELVLCLILTPGRRIVPQAEAHPDEVKSERGAAGGKLRCGR